MQRLCMLLTLSFGLVTTSLAANEVGTDKKPIAALYETSYTDSDGRVVERGRWYFVRQRDRIETASGDHAEVWERYAGGQVSLRRLFGDHEIAIEYSPGELAARGVVVAWEALGSVIAPKALARLKEVKTIENDRAVLVLKGQLNGEDVEIRWLPREHVPALVKRTGPYGTFTMRLAEAHSTPPRGWLPSSRWPIGNFRTVDAADLGDLEHDPEIQRLMRANTGGIGEPHAH